MRILAATALTVSFGVVASAVSAEEVTWRREYVRQWEIAAMERALGKDFAARFSATPFIVGGTKAPAGAWPFAVALLDSAVANKYNAQFCDGALVDKLFVVTAAHCVFGSRPAQINVLTGTQSLKLGGTRRQVAAIKIHPSYNDNTTDFDIAVIKLKTAATGIAVSKLITRAQEPAVAKDGTLSTVVGWGNMKETGSNYPVDLRQVAVPLVARSDCNDANSYRGAITARMICAGYRAGGKDACDGDSGGPLMVKDGQGKWTLQAGIVSWGSGCARPNLYGVYARVALLSAWANQTITGSSFDGADCAMLPAAARDACIDAAIGDSQRAIQSYLMTLRAQSDAAAVDTGQRAWANSLDSLCALDAVIGGATGRRLCLLKEMEKRAATLAEKLSLGE